MSKLIYTRVSLRVEQDDTESDEIKKLIGNDEREPDVWGKATFLIDEVAAIAEHYPSTEGPDPDTCNVSFKNGKMWGVQIPYEDLKSLLREHHGEGEYGKKGDVGHAVAVLTNALETEDDLYNGYRDNIAMAFKDEYGRYRGTRLPGVDWFHGEREGIHEVANQAAKNFLDQLIGSTQ